MIVDWKNVIHFNVYSKLINEITKNIDSCVAILNAFSSYPGWLNFLFLRQQHTNHQIQLQSKRDFVSLSKCPTFIKHQQCNVQVLPCCMILMAGKMCLHQSTLCEFHQKYNEGGCIFRSSVLSIWLQSSELDMPQFLEICTSFRCWVIFKREYSSCAPLL